MNNNKNCVEAFLPRMNFREGGCEQWRENGLDAHFHRTLQDVT